MRTEKSVGIASPSGRGKSSMNRRVIQLTLEVGNALTVKIPFEYASYSNSSTMKRGTIFIPDTPCCHLIKRGQSPFAHISFRAQLAIPRS